MMYYMILAFSGMFQPNELLVFTGQAAWSPDLFVNFVNLQKYNAINKTIPAQTH